MSAIALIHDTWPECGPDERSPGPSALAVAIWDRLCACAARVGGTDGPLAVSQAAPAAESVSPADLRDVAASLGGDGEAYARLVRRHQEAIAATMWRFTRDPVRWEELVQDVFVEAYVSLPGYRGRAPLLHWLRKIATRVGYRFWRMRARRPEHRPVSMAQWDAVAARDSSEVDAAEAAEVVHAVLERLAPRDRLVLTLIYLEGCSVAEAAQQAGWTQTMVKVQAHRARKRLRRLLEKETVR